MSKQRRIHPNSIQALKDAAARREVTRKRVNMTLTEEAIARLDSLVEHLGPKSRSDLIERLSKLPPQKLIVLLCASDPNDFEVVHKSRLP